MSFYSDFKNAYMQRLKNQKFCR